MPEIVNSERRVRESTKPRWSQSHDQPWRGRWVRQAVRAAIRKLGGDMVSVEDLVAATKVSGTYRPFIRRCIKWMISRKMLILHTVGRSQSERYVSLPEQRNPSSGRGAASNGIFLTVDQIEAECRKVLPTKNGVLEIRFDSEYDHETIHNHRDGDETRCPRFTPFGRWVLRAVTNRQERVICCSLCGPYGLLVEAREIAASKTRKERALL